MFLVKSHRQMPCHYINTNNHSHESQLQHTLHTFCSSICKTNNLIKLKYRRGHLQYNTFSIFPVMKQQYLLSFFSDRDDECKYLSAITMVYSARYARLAVARVLALLTLQGAKVVIKVRAAVINALPHQTHIIP